MMVRAYSAVMLPYILASLILDQVSKIYMREVLLAEPPHWVIVNPILNFRLFHNEGISFSWFNNLGASGPVVLSLIAVGIILLLLWNLRDPQRHLFVVGTALIIGGAIGNMIDRIRIGAVIDFLDFHIGNWHPFIFNIADVAISIGVICLVADILIGQYFKSNRIVGQRAD